MRNYYDLLDLSSEATPEEIKDAYRMMAMVWHPDRFRENPKLQKFAEERFKEVNEAYEVLSDEEKRRVYDEENEFVVQKPKPVVLPKTIDFGVIMEDQGRTSKTFRVENQGGPAKELNFDYPPNSWFQVGEIAPASEEEMFPLEVKVWVETEELTPGRGYNGKIVVDLDGEKAEVEVLLRKVVVRRVVAQPVRASTRAPAPIAATTATPGGNVLNWCARGLMWFIILGNLMLFITWGYDAGFSHTESALTAFLIAALGLVGSLGGGYVLLKTNNFKNPENASTVEWTVAIATMLVGAGPLLGLILLLMLVLWGVGCVVVPILVLARLARALKGS